MRKVVRLALSYPVGFLLWLVPTFLVPNSTCHQQTASSEREIRVKFFKVEQRVSSDNFSVDERMPRRL
ncbi:hypothetical protein scyTo_0003080 [Scyliorhinus torazame]|uniref:Uncharacterized protein n=1 Tax=Scyliorhinus torazame TaxID=75743 RepID=A0A401PLH9_SCYTO|nr:hypothetical protein [Scyliorhinus torazame]